MCSICSEFNFIRIMSLASINNNIQYTMVRKVREECFFLIFLSSRYDQLNASNVCKIVKN